jgi:ubiquinone/menaquinone biosynthesis C-methylase UbiE
MKKLPKYAFGLTFFLRIFIITITMVLLIVISIFLEISLEIKLLTNLIIVIFYITYLLIFFKSLRERINYELSEMVKLSELKGNEIVLDLGAGTGPEAVFFAKSIPKGKVFGLDTYLTKKEKNWAKTLFIFRVSYFGNTFENAKKNAITEGVADRCEFIIGDYTQKLDFPDEYFDIIISRQSLYLMPINKFLDVFQEVDRCLKKGGKIIFYETKVYKKWNIFNAERFFKNKEYEVKILRPRERWMHFLYAKKPEK